VRLLVPRRSPTVSNLDLFRICLCTTLSVIWTYELIYHYSFLRYWNPIAADDLRILFLDVSLSSLLVVGHKHISIRQNYLFLATIVAFTVTYGLWLAIGFPNFPTLSTRGLYLLKLLYVEDPFTLGYILNSLSRLILCIAWITLYAPARSCQLKHTRHLGLA